MTEEITVDEIKSLIIEKLNLEDLTPSDIDSQMLLFGDEGLGLDSVDALELSLAISKQYGIALDSKTDQLKEAFRCVESLTQFIKEKKSEN